MSFPMALQKKTVNGGGNLRLNVFELGNPHGPAIIFIHNLHPWLFPKWVCVD